MYINSKILLFILIQRHHSFLSNEEIDHVEKQIYKAFKPSNQIHSQKYSQSQANQQKSQRFTQLNKAKKKTLFDAFADECNK